MPTKKAPRKAPAKKVAAKKIAPKKAIKKAAKKAVAKKSPKKTTGKKSLVYAADHESFWVNDGRILNSLVALRDAFDVMDKTVYVYHSTGDQNDFAVWVDGVLCDASCARDLKKAKSPKTAKTVIVRHLKAYAV